MNESVRDSAWKLLDASVVRLHGGPVGTVAARDTIVQEVNYDQVFTRDFAVSAYAYLLAGKPEIVANFLLQMVRLQQTERQFDCFQPGEGLMPASFKVVAGEAGERVVADFGEQAIARVPPVDSGLWWLMVLHAYVNSTGDAALARRDEVQRAIRGVLDLCLTARFDMFPTMLVPDGSFMIDRRMGVYGYPIDVQALFYSALTAAEALLADVEENVRYIDAVRKRRDHLAYHIRTYYWLDLDQVNRIYRYGVEEYGERAVNKFNIYPETIPHWLMDWLPETGGYFAGNLGPGRMDYRYFAQGNLLAVASGLASDAQSAAFMQLLRARRDDLVGDVPLKLAYPALDGSDWVALTGMDPKNRAWSYHNGGNWPVLLWLLAAACARTGDADLIESALESAESRLVRDEWAEYYDGRSGRLVGRQARRQQTWTIAGYLVARQLAQDPACLGRLGFRGEATVSGCTG
ncbi:glycoside hydrolase 100 family protein [Thioalkalivibrio paradoxus]|uniref:beta-fructofuranosidase n=1 Tax=Thioalkalivibrio paradoxus ARh 1 TaxID=713585 RepID=W0DNG7_9GAMM|nr:glycoside hydrolase 100 family protein [Thioalkalivibrio paradoxus]AHE98782.1 alkaline invertase [Thioalkalivibrio paradoxus ARh 1]